MRAGVHLGCVLLALHLGVMDLSAAPTPPRAEKKESVGDADYKFQVSLDPRSGRVQVDTLKRNKDIPQDMSITIFSDPETSQTIQLKAMNLNDPLPHYKGQLAHNVGSYIGVELRFETSGKALKVLRSIPPLPTKKR